jgi:hypothetical protein
LTGCVPGHGPPDSNDPLAGYATWSLWLGLSRSLPFQHLFSISSISLSFGEMANLRREGNSGPNTTTTRRMRQIKRISTRTRCAAEWILLHVAEAAVANLLLLAFSPTKTWVADDHPETLQIVVISTYTSQDGERSIVPLETQ